MSNRVVLSLGGNVGNVHQTLLQARASIARKIGKITLKSSIYSTQAWGEEEQTDFLNQVIVLQTKLSPNKVLEIGLEIEKELGRIRLNKKKWKERVIDIDVLFYNNEILKSTDLTIPHPYIQDRNFVLFPLAEIIPDYIHPSLQKTVIELKKSCKDKLQVCKTLN